MKQRTFDFPEAMLERLRIQAERNGISQGEAMRQALAAYLTANQTPYPPTCPPTSPHVGEPDSLAHVPAHKPAHKPARGLEEPLGGGLSVSSWEGGGSSSGRVGSTVFQSVVTKEGSGGEDKLRETKLRAAEGFPEFWVVYPRKDGKKAAMKAWLSSYPTRPPLEDLLASLRAQIVARGWPTQYTPHAATWLNGERWNDPAAVPNGNGNGNGHHRPPERPYLDPFWRAFFDDPAGEKRTARVARALASQGATLAPEQRAEVERLDRETP